MIWLIAYLEVPRLSFNIKDRCYPKNTYALMHASPKHQLLELKAKAEKFDLFLQCAMRDYFGGIKNRLLRCQAMLALLNPTAILEKGYSITRALPARTVITASDKVAQGQTLEILLAAGRLHVIVDKKLNPSKD